MEIILQREKIRSVLARWERQYPVGSGKHDEVTAKLRTLDFDKVSAAEVDAIIGNGSWTSEMCGECSQYAMPVVGFGSYGDRNIYLCQTCIGKAAVLADAFAKLR